MMDFILSYWPVIVALIAIFVVIVSFICKFAGLPTAEQLANIREWLLWAVTSAEKELGSGTGQLKLHSVYDMFIQRFPQFVRFIPFSTFSDLVDDALDEMRDMLEKNEAVRAIVDGGENK